MKIQLVFSSLILAITFTSCNGQVKTKENGSELKAIASAQPRKSSGLLQDKAGNFWFCNGKEGVYRYNGKSFVNFTEKDGLSSRFVYCILEDKSGMLWFGTADGITCYNGKTFSVIPITAVKGKNFIYTKTKADETFDVPYPVQNFVLSILQDSRGVFWFGTSDGIYQYNPSKDYLTGSKTFMPFPYNDSIKSNQGGLSIESMLEDKAGNIWFGGRGTKGVYRYDGKSLTNYSPDGDNWIIPVFEDKTGNIWFGRRNPSVYRYDGKIFNVFGEKEFADWVLCMAEDKAGHLWMCNGKNGGGILLQSRIRCFKELYQAGRFML